jgi:hypothetical protein
MLALGPTASTTSVAGGPAIVHPMRWLVVLFLSACATDHWAGYEVDRGTRPDFLDALRDAQGEAKLVAGDRCYVIHATALQSEIRALTAALADTIEEQGGEGPPGDSMGQVADQNAAPVVGYTFVDRALSVGRGEIVVRGIRTDHRYLYWIEVRRRSGEKVLAMVAATPAVDAAWMHLVTVASQRAGTIGAVFLGNWDIDDLGVDVRGVGGARPGGGKEATGP